MVMMMFTVGYIVDDDVDQYCEEIVSTIL